MIELKKEVNELCDWLGQPPRYPLEFEKETGPGHANQNPTLHESTDAVEQKNEQLQQLQTEVERRFGVLQNFFRLAPETPEITANLWGFARFAYLDNPLPSLFKERLFVYLSRFCEVRYCIVRHLGFLVGLGRPSGDERSPVQAIEEVLRLLRRTLPRGVQAEPHIARCAVPDAPLAALPPPDSDMEEAMFTCAAHAFLQTSDAPRCLIALKRALGEVRFEHLMVFLAFVRTAHYWTKVHTELVFEEDVKRLLATHELLAECVLNDPEADSCDIPDRKRAEAELQKSNAELEKRVLERTTELLSTIAEREKLQEQLLQAQKLESIGTLAGGIAHDFNNILNIIQGHAFILRGHGAQAKEISESLAVIDETIQRGTALAQQLLTLGRKTEVKFEAVDVNRLIEGLIELIKQTFAKTIELSLDLAPHLPLIMVDGNQFGQALLNLAVNARDAMPKGGRLIFRTSAVDGASLRHLGEVSAERYVCIEVADTGVGMDERVQQRIFEPFFTTKEIGRGTGLGLSVVHGIMKNHSGLINVESKPMSGTSFRLYFPIPLSEKSTRGPVATRDTEIMTASNGKATVLLVEDEEHMLYLLEKILSKHGYKVLKASDGETAIKTYERHKETIDIVLLDVGLPKLAGRDVLIKVKSENPDAKIVVASGYLEPELKSEIDRTGVKYFLQKPYVPNEVIKIFQSVMGRES